MAECIFCRISKGEITSDLEYQDEEVIAFRDIHPQAPTHFLVVPRRHIPSLVDAEADHQLLLGKLQSVAIGLARREGVDRTGFRLVVNCGNDGGQSVWHLHLHLLGGRKLSWPPG